MEFAIIENGGKQYKITPDSVLELDRLDTAAGYTVVFDKVLMVVNGDDIQIGSPYLTGVSFEGMVDTEKKGKKIRILRFKAKSRYRRRTGFRHSLSVVKLGETKKTEPKKATAETAEKPKAKPKKAASTVKTAAKTTTKAK